MASSNLTPPPAEPIASRSVPIKKLHPFLFQLHLWIGWIAALPNLIVCATGFPLAFEKELHRIEEPEHYRLTPTDNRLPLAEVLRRYDAAIPRLVVNHLSVPQVPDRAYLAFSTQINADGSRENLKAYLNPYTGEITRVAKNRSFVSVSTALHRELIMGKAGKQVVAWSSLLLAITSIIGIVLWWPMRARTFARAVRRGNALDWHNVLGLIAIAPLAIMAVTGVSFTWGKHAFPLLEKLQGKPSTVNAPTLETQEGSPAGPQSRVSAAEAAERIAALFPEAKIIGVQPSNQRTRPHVFLIKQPGVSSRDGTMSLFIDPSTGLEHSRADTRDTGPVCWYRRQFGPLHTFGYFPAWVRLLWGALSFVGAVLVATGVWISIRNRFRKRPPPAG